MRPEQLPPDGATPVRRLLLALVAGVCDRPRLVLALSLLLAALSVGAAATRLHYHTRRDDLLSAHKDCQRRWRAYLAEFGDDDDMVVVVKGTDKARMEQALEALAAQVRAQPERFDRLFYKVDLRHLRSRALLFLSEKEIADIRHQLTGMRPLLEVGPLAWSGLSLSGLLQEAESRADKLSPGQPLSADDRQFFAQLAAIARAARATLDDPAAYANPWGRLVTRDAGPTDPLAEPTYFFSGDGTLAFLLARPVKEEGSFTAARDSVAAMRAIVAGVAPEFPELEVGLTGMPVLETDEMVAAERDTRLASWLAVAGVTLLFLLVYRSVYYPALTVVTLLVGTAWAMGWLTLTVGHLNILSATFAVMLIGMGDYGVLWVMRYEHARREGADVRAALLHTTAHVAVGNLTAASTLALAFFAAMLADFKAVAELGWIAGCGVLLCAFACFTVLPALLMLFDRRPSTRDEHVLRLHPAFDGGWLPGLARRPGWVLAGCLALVAAVGACAARVRYDHNLLHLQAQGLDSVRWEMTLIEHTAGASWHALSYTDTPEEALALKARYERLPGVSRVVEVASLVPPGQEAKLEALRDLRHRLRKLPARGRVIPHLRPDSDDLHAARLRLDAKLAPLAANSPVLAEARDGVRGVDGYFAFLRAQKKDVGPAEGRLQRFEERLAGDLAEDLHKLRDVATPAPITVADLPPALRERYVGVSGKWLLRVFAKDCLWDFGPLEQFTEQVRAVDADATGKPFGTVEGLQAMRHGLQRAGLYAFLVIVLVLVLDFRRGRDALLALAPLVLGVLLTVGVMGLLGLPLNPANMIAFPLILGVGVDNGVHVLHDYLIRRREGRAGVSRAIGRGVLVKALTTMIGFGALMVSTERGLVSLGLVLTLGVGCSMLAALVLLPAALHLLGQGAAPAPAVEEQQQPARLAA